ncbi:MAG: serine/threonine protein kinase, partial [Bdellovibrionales bacterium]|nr:serine/threonine protein kinase [Bdellovibrionales bacterium]
MNHFEPLGLGAGSFIAGRYDVVTRLGAGGMSAVFKVVDRKLNNDTIALKLFEPKLLSDASQLERFRQEVLITRKLTHPNIVRTHDFGEAPESHYYFMTMEYVPGVGLDKLIHSHEPPTFVESMRIFCEVLKGVAYAHEMGVIHRDLKPANILVGENNEVKIADFGLAKSLEMNKQFTQAGECVGTPFYMAPEQIQEQELDERTDVYALGIIAYELVMGKVPFDKESWFDLASQIIKEPLQDFATKKNRVPFWFQEFVKRATAKRKEERFRSVQEML